MAEESDGPTETAVEPSQDELSAGARLGLTLPGALAVASVAAAAVLFLGVFGLPAAVVESAVMLLVNAGLVLLGVTVALHAWKQPLAPRRLSDDREQDRELKKLAMEVVHTVLLVLTGVAFLVQAGAVSQALAGAEIPEAAVGVFRQTYLFALAAFVGATYAALVVRSWSRGARRTGRSAAVPALLAGLSAVGALTVQLELIAGLKASHAIFAANVGFVVIGAYTLWFARFPSPFKAFVQKARELPRMSGSIRRRVILVSLIAGTLALFGVAGALAVAGGIGVVNLGGTTGLLQAAVVTLVTTGLVVVFAFLITARFSENGDEAAPVEEAELIREKRMSAEELRFWILVGASAATSVTLVVLAVLTGLGHTPLPQGTYNDLIVFALLTGIAPYGLHAYLKRRRIEGIEDKFPELLRDLTEAYRAGMTLPQAVRSTAKANYGMLTEELRRMSAEISWGVSFQKSLENFANRIDTPLINRSVALILQASSAGGDVEEILTAASRDAREIRIIQEERKMNMSIYVMIVYIAFFVFLTVIAIMGATFIPAMAEAGGSVGGSQVGGTQIAEIDPRAFNVLFFHAAVIQALGGGLVAGIMGEGYPEAGLKHGTVLLVVAYVAFRLLIGL